MKTHLISPKYARQTQRWRGFAALPLLPLLVAMGGLAQAQSAPYPISLPNPSLTAQAADPRSPVPAAVHRSAATELQGGVETGSVDWRRANDEVGQFKRGHIDLLKLEQSEPAKTPAADASNAAPAPAQAPASAPSASPALSAGPSAGANSTAMRLQPLLQPGTDGSAELADLLKAPLSAEAAVRVALLNNPGLQIALGQEGVNISSAVPEQHPAKLQARQQIVRLSTQVRQAWTSAVAAAQTVDALTQARDAAEASGALARRLARVGNWSRLQQARQQVFLAEAAADLARAELAAFGAREKLVVLLGLWGAQAQLALPAQLPELPAQARELPDIETRALQARSDLALAASAWQRQRSARSQSGIDAWWDAQRDDARLREMAVKARSEARDTYQRYRSHYALARLLQDELVPLRQFISDEMLLRYNGMLGSVFDVLADARAQALARNSAIEARRDFWLADAGLQSLLAGVSPGPALDGAASAASASKAGPAGH